MKTKKSEGEDKMPLKLKNTYYEKLPGSFYSRIDIKGTKAPELLIFNGKLAKELGFNEEEISVMEKEGSHLFSGNKSIKDSVPIAQAYAGHQFGHFTMLGDGRAVLLGEKETKDGNLYDIHLKGAGVTPYSRRGDGKAVLTPMLREYIISEGMYYLGIPTTRSLAIIKTGEKVLRESEKEGAILVRIAKSHIRVGTFQFVAEFGSYEDLKKLADYTIDRLFPHIADTEEWQSNRRYLLLVREVVKRQANLIAQWGLTGFVHGVMNTDNMSISGETLDYGPCAFMDIYYPDTVFSSIDIYGRYSYGNQPYMGLWNLTVFSESIYPLFDYIFNEASSMDITGEEAQILLQHELLEYNNLYRKYWVSGMGKKLGLAKVAEKDELLFKELLEIMKKYKADYTNTFVALTEDRFPMEDNVNGPLYSSLEFQKWKEKWKKRLTEEGRCSDEIKNNMRTHNPFVIPRNHIVDEVLEEAEKGNLAPMENLLEILSHPYDHKVKIPEKYKIPKITKIPYTTYCGT